METGNVSTSQAPQLAESNDQAMRKQRLTMIVVVVVVIIFIGLIVTGIVLLASVKNIETVSRVRDIFIILMALESLLIGAALTILIIQIARLTNLLENEVKPILDSTNETISNLRGTTKFLSDNLVEPVIKLNEVIAVIQRLTDLLKFTRKR